MEALPTDAGQQSAVNEIYQYAANLLVRDKRSNEDVVALLKGRGLDEDSANTVVNNLQMEITKAKKGRAHKDMLYGGLWCVGGTIATMSHIGFIFWGAIVFGGIQFFKGLINL